jgi:hypothetical protein
MNKLLRVLLCTTLGIFLSSCGGGSNNGTVLTSKSDSLGTTSSSLGSTSSPTKTSSFTVTLDLEELTTSQTQLTNANFAVISVDLSGKILEKQSIDKALIQKDDFYRFNVSFAAALSTNKLLVVDIQQPLNISVGSNIKNKSLLYTPLTNHEIAISLYIGL